MKIRCKGLLGLRVLSIESFKRAYVFTNIESFSLTLNYILCKMSLSCLKINSLENYLCPASSKSSSKVILWTSSYLVAIKTEAIAIG